jgi:ABC-type multidrug transport system ATPase subunit
MAALGVDGRLSSVVVARLSAGQRRRASIAAMVARRPRLWLLDEPHAGLDQTGRDVIDGLLRSAAAAGATVLVASHELDRAKAIADRTVTIAGGTIQPDADVLASTTADTRGERRQNAPGAAEEVVAGAP